MDKLSIGEVAHQMGVRPSTLRYYESVGLLPPPRRAGGRRQYGADALQRLAVIQAAKRAGFTLAEIRTLIEGVTEEPPLSERWRPLAEKKIVEMEHRIAQAERMMRLLEDGLRCQCQTLETCVIIAVPGCADSQDE